MSILQDNQTMKAVIIFFLSLTGFGKLVKCHAVLNLNFSSFFSLTATAQYPKRQCTPNPDGTEMCTIIITSLEVGNLDNPDK